MTVTCRRSTFRSRVSGFAGAGAIPRASGSAAPDPRLAPQRGQKAKPGAQGKPQAAQGAGCRHPHRGQKAKPGVNPSKPQPLQVIALDRQSGAMEYYNTVHCIAAPDCPELE
jgi:hypothetical protein